MALREALPTLSARSRGFCRKPLMQAADRGLSEKQMFWVRKLAENKLAASPTVDLGNFQWRY